MAMLDTLIRGLAVLIEFGGGLVVVLGCLRGTAALVGGRGSRAGIVAAQLAVAEGVVAALGFKTAATLLKTIELRSWDAILMFCAVFAVRTVVKQGLVLQDERLRAGRTGPAARPVGSREG